MARGRRPVDDVARELETLGYGALWSSGRFDPGLSPQFEKLLASTTRVPVASGIVSIWASTPEDIGAAVAELEARFPGRFLLGLGASHAPIVEHYARPYAHMVAYLDALDALDTPVPPDRRVLAALGPRMLELAAARATGAHPYFVPVEHTARARQILGPGPLLAPEVAVVLEADPARARGLARGYARTYLGLPNYTQNLRTFGYGDDDIGGGGSDRLIDAVIPWGDAATVAARVRQHLDAGADHVCVQVVAGRQGFPLDGYRQLARCCSDGRDIPTPHHRGPNGGDSRNLCSPVGDEHRYEHLAVLLEPHFYRHADVHLFGKAVHHVGGEAESLLLHQLDDRDVVGHGHRRVVGIRVGGVRENRPSPARCLVHRLDRHSRGTRTTAGRPIGGTTGTG